LDRLAGISLKVWADIRRGKQKERENRGNLEKRRERESNTVIGCKGSER